MKITKCDGNGQGVCNRCGGIVWMTLLYKIENVQGIYCSNCVRKMKYLVEVEDMEFSTTVKVHNSLINELIGLSYKMGYCNGLLEYVDNDSDREFIEAYKRNISEQAKIVLNKQFEREEK